MCCIKSNKDKVKHNLPRKFRYGRRMKERVAVERKILVDVEQEGGNERSGEGCYKNYDSEYDHDGIYVAPTLRNLHSSSGHSSFLNDISTPLLPDRSSISWEQDYCINDVDGRDRVVPTSSFGQAVLNGMNTLCGVGLLSTVYAVKQGGWLSLTILLTFAMLSFYTGILLRQCVDSKPSIETYLDIGQAAFGAKGKLLISICLYMELYVSCVEFIILESDTLSLLFPNAYLNIVGLRFNSYVMSAIATTLIVLPTTWLRDLRLLSYISAGGVAATVILVSTLCWVGIVDDIGFKNEGGKLINWSGIPFAVGLNGYYFAGHAVFPNLYCSLKKRSQYSSVLLTSFLYTFIMMGGTAIIGYMMFGESTLSEFTLNIPSHLVASKIAICTTLVSPLCKYALALLPVSLSLEELIPENMKSLSCSIAIRTSLVLSSLLVAVTVPFFDLVMAFAGSALAMFMSLIFPCACFLSIARDKLTFAQTYACILTIALGFVVAIVGTYSAVSKIAYELVH